MRKYVIKDASHAENIKSFDSNESAMEYFNELKIIPWGTWPNESPCTNENCAREYQLIEYDTDQDSWDILSEVFLFRISNKGVNKY